MSVYGTPTQFDLDLLREAERTLSGRRSLDSNRVRNAYSPLQPVGVGSSGSNRSESRNVSPAHTLSAANTSGGVSVPAGMGTVSPGSIQEILNTDDPNFTQGAFDANSLMSLPTPSNTPAGVGTANRVSPQQPERPSRPQPIPSLPWTRPHRLNQEELQRQLEMLLNDQCQSSVGRRIAGITTTNTITTTYKDGGPPRTT
ncbi:hypothetical protein OS493_002061 [Desmophyllum pertusum]|uniref:Uncharacterized protein n=1 Tax=Desmophyllum pertusum TaxID=174260 RepID=A0A9X0CV18_9CNID|nr:hypothetical protein OS493_002061 [Desmophyllum pertusum]